MKRDIISPSFIILPGSETHQEYILKLLQAEVAHRENTRQNKFMNLAGFYHRKSFDGFRFDEVTLPDVVTPAYLKNCEFIKTKTNVVMYGNVGTEKTYLFIALGMKACKRGISTRFFSHGGSCQPAFRSEKKRNIVIFYKEYFED